LTGQLRTQTYVLVDHKMEGTIKFFNIDKGFGFISAEDGKEYFVHITALNEGIALDKGDNVSFEVEEGERGPKASNVSKQ